MALTLRTVRHIKAEKNRYCGPSAISAVTGMNSGEAARLIRRATGSASVKGTSSFAMEHALYCCGVSMNRLHSGDPDVDGSSSPTLAAWFKSTSKIRKGGRVFLVSAGNHWQLVRNARFVCGLTKEVVPLTHDKVRRRARVKAVWELKGTAKIPDAARKPTSQRKAA